MNNNIRNYDKQGKLHGEQKRYYDSGNICWIENWYHGKLHGYHAWFNLDNSIHYKEYFNMDKRIYEEAHWGNQIEIKI